MDRGSPATLELAVVTGTDMIVVPLPAGGSVTIGRGEECDVRIDNGSISRRHAALHLGPPLRIEDLGSVNGTLVRDDRVAVDAMDTHPLRKLANESSEIVIGECVSLGAFLVVVRRIAPAAAAGAAREHMVVRDADGQTPAMQELYKMVTRAAMSTINVLILGETGVGKEVVARAIHDRSQRARAHFLALNCAALPPSLLEAELFGHEKHAFTGANQARPGLFESADGGTVFIDEIGELPAPVQVKLLRVLEDRKVLRIGGRSARTLDVRFIAATHRDLKAHVEDGVFRQDLYFRLNGLELVVPPLRERVAEIAPLAAHFLTAAREMLDRSEPVQLSDDALKCLERYAWPGNVRELRNIIERAVVLLNGNVIGRAELPAHLTGTAVRTSPSLRTKWSSGEEDERQRIVTALDACAGNQTRAAKQLGMSRRTLLNRISKYEIPRPRK